MFTIMVATDGVWEVVEDVELRDWYSDERSLYFDHWIDIESDCE